MLTSGNQVNFYWNPYQIKNRIAWLWLMTFVLVKLKWNCPLGCCHSILDFLLSWGHLWILEITRQSLIHTFIDNLIFLIETILWVTWLQWVTWMKSDVRCQRYSFRRTWGSLTWKVQGPLNPTGAWNMPGIILKILPLLQKAHSIPYSKIPANTIILTDTALLGYNKMNLHFVIIHCDVWLCNHQDFHTVLVMG